MKIDIENKFGYLCPVMKRVSTYIDIAFCLVLLPLMLFAFPVEKWWATRPVFFSLFIGWLYVTYFIYKYFIVPYLLHGGRRRLYAVVAMVISFGVTFLFSAYHFSSPYHQLRKEMEAGAAYPVWGFRPNQQAVWLHYIIVVIFCFAVGMLAEVNRQRRAREEMEKDKAESAPRQIMMKSEYKTIPVSISSIVFAEAVGNYIRVHLSDGTSFTSKIALSRFEQQLPPNEFVRIHRSYIVAKGSIAKFAKTERVLANSGKVLPVGKKYLESIKVY
ncbi:MAG: LytR/AlgR family response regulator transcription factor [Candidatus Cryptobacteroides sp.]